MYNNKPALLSFFRDFAEKELAEILKTTSNYKERAKKINSIIKFQKDSTIKEMLTQAKRNKWENKEILNRVLCITYTSYIVMLECRNRVWPYEYMAFSRRIGELWEPFCKETFYYPIKPLKIIQPPLFNDVQDDIKRNVRNYIESLNLDQHTKKLLLYYYNIPWSLVDSGGIQLGLDLHFSQNNFNYNCDFKSGFSSNEKGNTNRLLLVASIYRFLSEHEKTIIFVRQKEDENNHYLQTLKNSQYWEVYCADEAYDKMFEFSGFNLRKCLNENAVWSNDISDELRLHLTKEDLIRLEFPQNAISKEINLPKVPISPNLKDSEWLF